MKLCYGMLVSSKEEELCRLIDAVNVNGNQIVIHVDIKSKDLYKNLISRYGNCPFIHFTDVRIDCVWGTTSLIRAMNEIMKIADKLDFDYYTLISESCIPFKTDSYIKDFLSAHRETEFMESHYERFLAFRQKIIHDKVDLSYRKHRNFHNIVDNIRLPFSLFKSNPYFRDRKWFYYGGNWSTITHSLLSYFVDKLQDGFYFKKYDKTLFSDEHILQEIVMASPYKNRLYKNGEKTANLVFVDFKVWDAPRKLKMTDLPKFIDVPDLMIARKFESSLDREVIEAVYKARYDENNIPNELSPTVKVNVKLRGE